MTKILPFVLVFIPNIYIMKEKCERSPCDKMIFLPFANLRFLFFLHPKVALRYCKRARDEKSAGVFVYFIHITLYGFYDFLSRFFLKKY